MAGVLLHAFTLESKLVPVGTVLVTVFRQQPVLFDSGSVPLPLPLPLPIPIPIPFDSVRFRSIRA